MYPINLVLNTNGKGLWSKWVRKVNIVRIELESEWNELCVYFNVHDWDIDQHGLIYTDPKFEKELLRYFNEILDFDFKLTPKHVSYSEQGMQGDNYVSFDVSDKFKDAWLTKNYNME